MTLKPRKRMMGPAQAAAYVAKDSAKLRPTVTQLAAGAPERNLDSGTVGRTARSGRVTDRAMGRVMTRMPLTGLPGCHALWGAPVRRLACIGPTTSPSPIVVRRTCSRGRLRHPDANGNPDIDGVKATKGRRMARDLAAGAKAPPFTVPRDGAGTVSLQDFKGRNLVLYFYPKADTPGCTKEAMAFSKLRTAFAKAGTDILGVSADSVKAQDKFKAKHALKLALGSDETKEMLKAYGAWGEKSLYGRKFMGVIRKTFLIDGNGQIVRVWPKVKVPGHAEEVLEAAKAL
jgi:thioredoxin-dependent peroxiredoxin